MFCILDNGNTGIPRDNAKRLLKDIKSIMKDPLHQEGIYYKHDETDMMKGYAMIVGPRDTIYENGFYFFDFIFPNDYPYSPPKLEWNKTEYIRFHPNFYKNGKVCISLLNTWPGDPWTSCQSIRSILITLSMYLIINHFYMNRVLQKVIMIFKNTIQLSSTKTLNLHMITQ